MALPELFRPRRALRRRESESGFMRPFDEMRQMMENFWMTPFEEFGQWGEGFVPKVDVTETEKEIRVSAELPGIDEKDIDVSLSHDTLTFKGEKKSEKEDRERITTGWSVPMGRLPGRFRSPLKLIPRR